MTLVTEGERRVSAGWVRRVSRSRSTLARESQMGSLRCYFGPFPTNHIISQVDPTEGTWRLSKHLLLLSGFICTRPDEGRKLEAEEPFSTSEFQSTTIRDMFHNAMSTSPAVYFPCRTLKSIALPSLGGYLLPFAAPYYVAWSLPGMLWGCPFNLTL